MFKFVMLDPEGLQRKRKQNHKACKDCRKRKKRCDHLKILETQTSGDERLDNIQHRVVHIGTREARPNSEPVTVRRKNHNAAVDDDVETPVDVMREHASNKTSTNRLPMEGHISNAAATRQPEEAALDLQSPGSRRSERNIQRFVGDLNPESIFISANLSAAAKQTSDLGDTGVWSMQQSSNEGNHGDDHSTPQQRHSGDVYNFEPVLERLLLPSLEQQCLSTMPPLADMEALSDIYYRTVHPILPVVDKESLEATELSNSASILLHQGVALAASASTGAFRHLHLASSNATLTQREFAQKISAAMRTSMYIGLVSDKLVLIQALVLLSLFMQTSDGGDTSAQMSGRAVHHVHSLGLHLDRRKPEQENLHEEPLFCTVWALDRLNAAFHGRPVLMHERDIGKDLQACFKRQAPCFRLFLGVVAILDKIIQLYRPRTVQFHPLPIDQIPDFEELLMDCGASREDAHLLATIETFYHAISILSCRSSFHQTPLRSSPLHIRLSFAASRITSIVSHEFHNQLSLIPTVPYAVSLSLSVAYRELRYSKVPMYQRRARTQLQVNCNLLKELGNVFWSAATMAEMGEQVLTELDRVLSLILEPHQQPGNKSHVVQQQTNSQTTDVPDLSSSNKRVAPNEIIDTDHVPPTFDPNFFDKIPDLDIFGQFDSSFDLDAIDAALGGGHLDMSLPPDFGDF